MPVVYRCSKCGKIIYVFWRSGQNYFGVPSPSELAEWNWGRCPHCGKPILMRPRGIRIMLREKAPKDLLREMQGFPK